MLKKLFQTFSQNKLASFLILLGTIFWSITMVKSGLSYSFGLGFWGPNGHDGVWHLALAESLGRNLREMPTFSGSNIQNYHVGFDLLVSLLNKLTRTNVSYLYFQIIPPILALLIGFGTYRLVYNCTKSKQASLWSLFFVYFGGGFGWLVSLLRSGEIGGESMFWSQQSISTLINPPFALSLVILLFGLNLLSKKNRGILDNFLCVLLFGLLIQIKVYAGILALGALLISGIWSLFKNKKADLILIFLASLGISSLVFFSFNKDAQSLLVFKPFWFLETMMGFTDRLNWPKFYSAMTNYRLGGVWLKGIIAYVVAFFIFWYGNIGTRLLKEILVLKWIKNLKEVTWLEVFFASVIVAGGIIPMFFLQKGTPWNTIQFFYYSLFFSGVLAGIAIPELDNLLKRRNVLFLKIAIVLLTIPTTFGTLKHYLPVRPPAMLTKEEQEALSYLSKEPNGVVLTFPFDSAKAKAAESMPPRPLYLYESTAYVSAYSNKPTFLEDEINLEITGFNWKKRRMETEAFFDSKDVSYSKNFLKKGNIRYIYLTGGQKLPENLENLGVNKIFENSQTSVFKVE